LKSIGFTLKKLHDSVISENTYFQKYKVWPRRGTNKFRDGQKRRSGNRTIRVFVFARV